MFSFCIASALSHIDIETMDQATHTCRYALGLGGPQAEWFVGTMGKVMACHGRWIWFNVAKIHQKPAPFATITLEN